MSSLLSPSPLHADAAADAVPLPLPAGRQARKKKSGRHGEEAEEEGKRFVNPTDMASADAATAALSELPPPFDPADEYRRLLESVAAEDDGRRGRRGGGTPTVLMDPYQQLMAKERRVLDTVDRVVNDSLAKRDADSATSSLLAQPVHVLAMRTAGALRALLDDLVASRSLRDVGQALSDPLRRPYIGVALVGIAVMMGMIELASG